MFWIVAYLLLLLLLLLLLRVLYVIWKDVADADMTLLWKERFGLQPGKIATIVVVMFDHGHY